MLAEMDIPTSIENIAVACFRLFPSKFQMCDYPQFPDMTRTNRALLQLRPKYRGWATGSPKQGFFLNATGEQIAMRTKVVLGTSLIDTPTGGANQRHREAGKETIDRKARLAMIRESVCFRKFEEDQEPRGLDFLDMLNVYSHTPPKAIRESLRLLRTMANHEGDELLLRFLKWCHGTFAPYLDNVKKGKKVR